MTRQFILRIQRSNQLQDGILAAIHLNHLVLPVDNPVSVDKEHEYWQTRSSVFLSS